jgi:hypothetical protein
MGDRPKFTAAVSGPVVIVEILRVLGVFAVSF